MGKIKKVNHRAHIATPYPSPPSCCKKEWAGSTCPVCLESPHNVVLLLCSSYKKGCRPYMCATSSRFANCLDQYRKSYYNVNSVQPELLCPLCRAQVKAWTVVEDARMHFNSKRRTCMQDKCSFVGNFRKLKKHMKEKHPHACPRAIDPDLESKWKRLERERDRRDVISTIMSSTPGVVVLGDYVIEPHNRAVYDEEDEEDDYSSNDTSNGILDLESWQGQAIIFVLSTWTRATLHPLPGPLLSQAVCFAVFSFQGAREAGIEVGNFNFNRSKVMTSPLLISQILFSITN